MGTVLLRIHSAVHDYFRFPIALLIVFLAILSMAPATVWADWPLFRADAARSARTDESLAPDLTLHWVYRASHPPQAAWPRSPRMQFDRAQPIVGANNRVVFGDSVTGEVVCLDGQTGETVWQKFTEGPIRFAPVIWQDRVFAVSDDGHLYALRLVDGAVLWKRRGGPNDASVLGNQTMISKWPARGGPVVVGDIVYFAAGIWPSEGIYLYALNANSGDQIWCNADSGSIEMPQPHPTANAKSGISAQGHLLVAGKHLLVPTGRAVPAVFDRSTGQLEYFHLQRYGHNGGTSTMAVEDVFVNSGLVFAAEGGKKVAQLGPGQVALSKDGVVRTHGTVLTGYVWQTHQDVDRKGKTSEGRRLEPAWTINDVPKNATVITAGNQAVLGCDGHVCLVDLEKREITQTLPVDGVAFGLAVSDGRLLASTDTGHVYCFANSPTKKSVRKVAAITTSSANSNPDLVPAARAAADEIVRRAGVSRGYCLDLGCGDGQLALALAARTELTIIAVDSDLQNVTRTRKLMLEAGIYGTRVIVQCRDESRTGYPRYFADLIVSGRSIGSGADRFPNEEAARLQRPYGGVICVGSLGKMALSQRGPLDGAGSWTHQYADVANTVCSGDQLVKGRLGMLWFRDVDLDIPSRHGRAPAPLFHDGRLFHEGMNELVAVNAYNGDELWRYQIPNVLKAYNGDELMGTAGTGSNFCVGDQSVFVRDGHRCMELNAATGALLREYQTPASSLEKRNPWGYVAWTDGMLFGSEADAQHIVTYRYIDRGGDMSRLLTESRSLFAFDSKTRKKRWQYVAENSIRHNAIAIGNGKIVLIDRPLAEFDRVKKPKTKEHPTGKLVALDTRTGELLWQNAENIFGTMLAIEVEQGIVLMSYQPTRFRLDSERGGRMAAFRLTDGERLWDIAAKYASRPMINGQTIYAQGGAWDLLTGKPVPFDFKRSYGCGILASSKHMLLFRSATLGYYDLSGAKQTVDYGGIRPACWINALPVGGVVLLPDATAGCQCSYLNKAWIGLEPLPDEKQ